MDVEVDMVRGDDGCVGETTIDSNGRLESHGHCRVFRDFYTRRLWCLTTKASEHVGQWPTSLWTVQKLLTRTGITVKPKGPEPSSGVLVAVVACGLVEGLDASGDG